MGLNVLTDGTEGYSPPQVTENARKTGYFSSLDIIQNNFFLMLDMKVWKLPVIRMASYFMNPVDCRD